MYEHITAFMANPFSFIIAAIGVAALLIHSITPVVLWLWGVAWGWLDDYETTYKNWYLDLFVIKNETKLGVIKESGLYYVVYNSKNNRKQYIARKNYDRISSCSYSWNMHRTYEEAVEDLGGAMEYYKDKPLPYTKSGERVYYSVYLLAFPWVAIWALVNYIPTFTMWGALVLAVVFMARAVRRLQKKAVKTLNEIKEHKADPDAHKGEK